MAEKTVYIIDLNDKVTPKLKTVQGEAKKTDSAFKGISSSLSGMGGTLSGIFGTAAIIGFGTQIIQTTAKFQSLSNSIKFASDTAQQGELSMHWLSNLSKTYGLPILELTEGFKTFQGAMMKTRFTANEVRTMFAQVSTGVTAMGLSSEDAKGTFLALGQIMGKGKVQAEELRGQIGERIPGAFAIAARAMGMSTSQLDKFMSDGKLLAEDFLPKFAAEMEKTFGAGALQSVNLLGASMTRASSAWTEMMLAIGNSDSNGVMGRIFNGWASSLDMIAEKFKTIDQLSAAATATGTLGELGTIESKLKKEVEAMKAGGSSRGDIEKYISGQVSNYRDSFSGKYTDAVRQSGSIERGAKTKQGEQDNDFMRFIKGTKNKEDLYEDNGAYKTAIDAQTKNWDLMKAVQPLADKLISSLFMPANVVESKKKTKKIDAGGLNLNESRNGATHITFNIDKFQNNEFTKDGVTLNNNAVTDTLKNMALALQTVLNDSQIVARQ